MQKHNLVQPNAYEETTRHVKPHFSNLEPYSPNKASQNKMLNMPCQ